MLSAVFCESIESEELLGSMSAELGSTGTAIVTDAGGSAVEVTFPFDVDGDVEDPVFAVELEPHPATSPTARDSDNTLTTLARRPFMKHAPISRLPPDGNHPYGRQTPAIRSSIWCKYFCRSHCQ
jgi:hypothetical protein